MVGESGFAPHKPFPYQGNALLIELVSDGGEGIDLNSRALSSGCFQGSWVYRFPTSPYGGQFETRTRYFALTTRRDTHSLIVHGIRPEIRTQTERVLIALPLPLG